MEQAPLPAPTPEQLDFYHTWWSELSPQWKKAYNEVCLSRSDEAEMPAEVVHSVHHAPALRFTGPTAPFPNMRFELSDFSGLLALKNLQILVVTFHQISTVRMLAELPQLQSLFLNNNRIQSLEGLEALTNLHELYVNVNEITSLKPLKQLTNLHTLYCNHNRIASLEGIGKAHAKHLVNFFCQPNEGLTDAVCIKFEHANGIRCRKA